MQKIKTKFLKTVLFILCMCYCLFNTSTVLANEISGKRNDLDIIFVIDVSGSMRSNDPGRIALDMVKAVVDTVHTENTHIGFIAYNDTIISSLSPVSMMDITNRDNLKELIDNTTYSGNTDIGLGLMNAYQSLGKDEERTQIIVLISDGETDLNGSRTGRTVEQSNQELWETVEQCQTEQIQIYTIVFGNYAGSKVILEQISEMTGASTHIAESPELLIEVLYDIFNDNLSYKIQKISTGIYASGQQELSYVFEEEYLNEIDILMISSRQIGESRVTYDEQEVHFEKTSYYAVGKITNEVIEKKTNELIINTTTEEGQLLDIYIISYRNLEPRLKFEGELLRNHKYSYQVYFQNQNGETIKDEMFYQNFKWHWEDVENEKSFEILSNPQVENGILVGDMMFSQTGEYRLAGVLYDDLGSYNFRTNIVVKNAPPTGNMPEEIYIDFSKSEVWDLNEFFDDANGDELSYSVVSDNIEFAQIKLVDSELHISPMKLKSGTGTIYIQVSDGEDTIDYAVLLTIAPAWKVYWWVIVIVIVLVSLVVIICFIFIVCNKKSKPAPVDKIKSQNQFSGRLDLYFTILPETELEIPPLVFPMYKLNKDKSKVHLGELLHEYPKEVEILGLEQVYLIADEGRKMILYHSSDATVMIGNSIVCRQNQYSLTFGDVLYITSKDGTYELELHYIAIIQ